MVAEDKVLDDEGDGEEDNNQEKDDEVDENKDAERDEEDQEGECHDLDELVIHFVNHDNIIDV